MSAADSSRTEATFRVTREVFEKFCEAADVQGYIGRIDFCAGLTAIGIKNEYVDDEPEYAMPDNTQATLDAKRLEAACKALALSDLQGRGPYGDDYRGEEQRERDIEYANTRWCEWQDDAEACIRAYLGSES